MIRKIVICGAVRKCSHFWWWDWWKADIAFLPASARLSSVTWLLSFSIRITGGGWPISCSADASSDTGGGGHSEKKFLLQDIAELIKTRACQRVVVMVGAGISTPSGIPDFRCLALPEHLPQRPPLPAVSWRAQSLLLLSAGLQGSATTASSGSTSSPTLRPFLSSHFSFMTPSHFSLSPRSCTLGTIGLMPLTTSSDCYMRRSCFCGCTHRTSTGLREVSLSPVSHLFAPAWKAQVPVSAEA